MSTWQIYKFGGSSLGAEGRLPVVLHRIAEAPRPVAVVVSALGDTTEWLLEAGRAAAAGDETQAVAEVERAFTLARTRAAEVLDPASLGELERVWRPLLGDAGRAISALVAARASDPAMLDLLLSVGERASSELVAAALRARNLPGLAVDARDVFVTDGRHGDATVNLDRSLRSVLERYARWERHVPVVTGFIGRGPAGATTTLGRNGSDYAATTLAALLDASEVTIWTDV
ncbi:MAG TPA: bifunctional aspartate kinase/homoserine dehydrogenase I, partial [Myxococcaceae bacterium]